LVEEEETGNSGDEIDDDVIVEEILSVGVETFKVEWCEITEKLATCVNCDY
jgi:hypothetical protein